MYTIIGRIKPSCSPIGTGPDVTYSVVKGIGRVSPIGRITILKRGRRFLAEQGIILNRLDRVHLFMDDDTGHIGVKKDPQGYFTFRAIQSTLWISSTELPPHLNDHKKYYKMQLEEGFLFSLVPIIDLRDHMQAVEKVVEDASREQQIEDERTRPTYKQFQEWLTSGKPPMDWKPQRGAIASRVTVENKDA